MGVNEDVLNITLPIKAPLFQLMQFWTFTLLSTFSKPLVEGECVLCRTELPTRVKLQEQERTELSSI